MAEQDVNSLTLGPKEIQYVVTEAQRLAAIIVGQTQVTTVHPAIKILVQLVVSELLEKNSKAITNNIKWHAKNLFGASQIVSDHFKFPGDDGYVDPREEVDNGRG